MRIFSVVTAVAFAAVIPFGSQVFAAQWPQATSHQPRVSIEVGALAMSRDGQSDPSTLLQDSSTNEIVLTGEQTTDLNTAAGVMGKVIFTAPRTGERFEVRGSYAGWDNEYSINNPLLIGNFLTAGILNLEDIVGIPEEVFNRLDPNALPPGLTFDDITPPGFAFSPRDIAFLEAIMPDLPEGVTIAGIGTPTGSDFYQVTEINSRYESEFASIECMARRNTRPGVTWLFGPRFVHVGEQVAISTAGFSPLSIFDPGVPSIPPTIDGDTLIPATASTFNDITNSLIGLQLGLEFNVPVTQDIYFQASGRAGAFYNSTGVDRLVNPITAGPASGFPTGVPADGPVSQDQVTISFHDSGEAFLAEFAIRGYVDFIPNTLAGYAGFEGVFISDLALAPNQVSISSSKVDRSGEMFAKSLSFGLKMNY